MKKKYVVITNIDIQLCEIDEKTGMLLPINFKRTYYKEEVESEDTAGLVERTMEKYQCLQK